LNNTNKKIKHKIQRLKKRKPKLEINAKKDMKDLNVF
jgi:hypothetical protein